MNQFANSALRDRRARIAGEIIALKKQIRRLEVDLEALDSAMVVLIPNYRKELVRPITFRKNLNLFRRHQLTRAVIDTLRRADGRSLTAFEIIDAVTVSMGCGDNGKRAISGRVRSCLVRLKTLKRIEKTGHRKSALWKLPNDL